VAEREFADEMLAMLSVAIGSIMEDEASAAVSMLPAAGADRSRHFEALRRAGSDIAALAVAAEVLLSRSATERRKIPLD